ncbi:MAG: tetratricopeptide repeat protein, partial [Gammaproteobacteria bacterium]|nr:tetratricopeptide repeat protein [Gammaproteobacteria bacterium]
RKGIREALALDPDLAEAHLVEGLMYERGRNLPAAIDSYQKTIAQNPSYAEAYVNLGNAALLMKDEVRAWQALDKARSLDPLSVSVLTAVASAALRTDRPDIAEDTLTTLDRLQPEVASEVRTSNAARTGEPARVAISLEQHRAAYPVSGFGSALLASAYATLGKLDEAAELEPEFGIIIAAQQGREEAALRLMEEIAAQRTDPHDRADVYWMAYCALGRFDNALEVLSDLWYGYAEEQMGPRMDGFDVDVFAMLLRYAGRSAEADRVVELIRANRATRGIDAPNGSTLFAQGRLDDAVRVLQERAERNEFDNWGIKPYFCYAGLDKHPAYPALVAKFEAWRGEQRSLYASLKAAE